ncbi:7911_t:CDS:2, partial [Funneliformis caledonium]
LDDFVRSGAFSMILEKPRERFIFTPGRTHNRSRSPRIGSKGDWRKELSSRWAGGSWLVLSNRHSGRRLTINLELCSECQSEEIQPSA